MSRSIKKKQQASLPGLFVRRFHVMIDSAAYRDLRPLARCLLEEIQRNYCPLRNGRIVLSVKQAAERLSVNKDTVTPAFHELAAHGFIQQTRGDQWMDGRAREWRLTFEECNGRAATHDWKLWAPGVVVFEVPKRRRKKPLPETGIDHPEISDRPDPRLVEFRRYANGNT